MKLGKTTLFHSFHIGFKLVSSLVIKLTRLCLGHSSLNALIHRMVCSKDEKKTLLSSSVS